MPNETVKNGLKAKKIQLFQMIFFSQKTTNKIFMYPLAPFILQNLKKILEPTLSYDNVPFLGPKWPICPEQNFLGTNHYYFYLPIGPFHCLKCKENSYSRSRVMRMHHFLARNGPFAPNKIFFGKLSISFSSIY